MPRLSLYKPEKGNDYKFMDRTASEMFQAGGTDVYVHKYLGANTDSANATADQPHYATTAVTNIQDLLFLENRDRKYESEIYRLRGFHQVQNIDFNLSQFGLFLDNDTTYMTVHINDFIKTLGRKVYLQDHYVHNFVGYQKDIPNEVYVFNSIVKPDRIIQICGWITKDDFFKKCIFTDKGQQRIRDDGSALKTRAPLYEIENNKLIQINSKEDLLKIGIFA